MELSRILLKWCKTHDGFTLTSLYPFKRLKSPGSSLKRGTRAAVYIRVLKDLFFRASPLTPGDKIGHSPQIQTEKGSEKDPLEITKHPHTGWPFSSQQFCPVVYVPLVELLAFPFGMGIPRASSRIWLPVTHSGLLCAHFCPQHRRWLGEFIKA